MLTATSSKAQVPNVSKLECQALNTLKEKNTLVKILPANKGNLTVILDILDYEAKLKTNMQESCYK